MLACDTSKPNAARIYDFLLGGKDHFAPDREVAGKLLRIAPESAVLARENRQFLQRAVRHVHAAGVTQFIDIGAGLPTVVNTHEVAKGARVVYVDHDPVVVAHARALLAKPDPNVIAVFGDLRTPQGILENPELAAHLDLGRPVAAVLVAVLHFVGEGAYEVVGYLRDRMAPGSYLVISHATADHVPPGEADEVRGLYADAAPLTLRSREQVARFFDGMALVRPGVTGIAEWNAAREPGPRRVIGYGGVGLKP